MESITTAELIAAMPDDKLIRQEQLLLEEVYKYRIKAAPIFLSDDQEDEWAASDAGFKTRESAREKYYDEMDRRGIRDKQYSITARAQYTVYANNHLPFTYDDARDYAIIDLVCKMSGTRAAVLVSRLLAQKETGLHRLSVLMGQPIRKEKAEQPEE